MELQRKQNFIQEDLRRKVPTLATTVESEEYVFYCNYTKVYFQAVTDKRFLLNARDAKGLKFGDWILQEAPWSEVVGIGDLRNASNFMGDRWTEFEIQTFEGSIIPRNDFARAMRLRHEAMHALSLHNAGLKDVRATILTLKPD